jgi:hypothetical protein
MCLKVVPWRPNLGVRGGSPAKYFSDAVVQISRKILNFRLGYWEGLRPVARA